MDNVLTSLLSAAEDASSAVQMALVATKELPAQARFWSTENTLSIADLLHRADNLATLSRELADLPNDRFLLTSRLRLNALRDGLQNLITALDTISTRGAAVSAGGGVSSFDEASGSINLINGGQANFAGPLNELQLRLDSAIDAYANVAVSVKPRAIGTFSAASRVLSTKATESEEIVSALANVLAGWKSELESIQSVSKNAKKDYEDAEAVLAQILKDRRTVDEDIAKIRSTVEVVDDIRTQATRLEATVTDYQEKFSQFDAKINSREKSIREGGRELNSLLSAFEGQKEAVAGLIEKAEGMLAGATTAGLGTTYQKQATAVDGQLENARRSFYTAIGLLLVSVAAALNVFACWGIKLASFPVMNPNATTGTFAVQALSALGARGILILPALLLVGFTARRHSALFRLREEYSHKYAAAASVQGFKLQAPTYEESIAAAVFAEVLKNPTSSMDRTQDEKRNGFLDRLILPRVKAALDRAAELPDNER